jgi:enhancer of polycomb-like protein
MRHSMTLLHDIDHFALVTDPTLSITTSDGKQHTVLPFRLGPQQLSQRPVSGAAIQRNVSVSQGQSSIPVNPSMPVGTPISMQAQLKKMHPPAVPIARIPSSGNMRPPATPNLPTMPNPHASQPETCQPIPLNGHDSTVDSPTKLNSAELPDSPQVHTIQIDGTSPQAEAVSIQSTSPTRSSSQPHAAITIPVMPNGYHINGYPPPTGNSSPMPYPGATTNGLSAQQMQTIKSAFAGIPAIQDMSALQANGGNMMARGPATYMAHVVPNGANYEMLRQMGWTNAQRIPSSGMNGSPAPGTNYSPQPGAQAFNGLRMPVGHVTQHLQPHSPSPHLQSPSPAPNAVLHSPPRQPSQTMPSPSLQAQQPVGAQNGRY